MCFTGMPFFSNIVIASDVFSAFMISSLSRGSASAPSFPQAAHSSFRSAKDSCVQISKLLSRSTRSSLNGFASTGKPRFRHSWLRSARDFFSKRPTSFKMPEAATGSFSTGIWNSSQDFAQISLSKSARRWLPFVTRLRCLQICLKPERETSSKKRRSFRLVSILSLEAPAGVGKPFLSCSPISSEMLSRSNLSYSEHKCAARSGFSKLSIWMPLSWQSFFRCCL
mmetsp:Transcript_75946/g.134122  ORF Transcript_75946/g.134122 Transcript_75946/m.134122 type:complete len:225 (+) Transcript_75946:376-1050(+)